MPHPFLTQLIEELAGRAVEGATKKKFPKWKSSQQEFEELIEPEIEKLVKRFADYRRRRSGRRAKGRRR